jgi:hypothetical protein
MANQSDGNWDPLDRAHREGQKRLYAKPVLLKHGNLRDITMKVSVLGKADGASPTALKSKTG